MRLPPLYSDPDARRDPLPSRWGRRGLTALAGVALVVVVVPASAGGSPSDPVGVWPLHPQPEVVERFDPPDGPYAAGHRGVDLAGSPGQVVRSALPGEVTYSGSIAGRGVVVVQHGETRTTYEPVRAGVAVGTSVEAGSALGRLELAGSHCFPRACLHWGWVAGATYLDPLRLVGAGPVRLLPLGGLGAPAVRPSAAGLGSGAGMGLLVGGAQSIGRDVRVELRGRQ